MMIARAKKDKVTAKKTAAKKTVVRKSTKKKVTEKVVRRTIGTKKKYLKSKNVCRVTYILPKIAAPDAKSVCIVGDFNNWNIHANPMKKLKNGDYTIQLDLEPEREYQYRYFIDESKWENDWNADKYARSLYGDSDNSVVMT